jgi:hypothetical protein
MTQAVCNPIRTIAALHSFPVMSDPRIDDRALMELGVLAVGLEAKIDAIGNATQDDDFEEERLTEPLRQALDLIHKKIMETPAMTITGLRVKAERVLWCRGGELHAEMDDPASDIRLAINLVRDLLAMEA